MAIVDSHTRHCRCDGGSASNTQRGQSRVPCSCSQTSGPAQSPPLALSLKRPGSTSPGAGHDGNHYETDVAAKRPRLADPGADAHAHAENLSAQDVAMFSPQPPTSRDHPNEESQSPTDHCSSGCSSAYEFEVDEAQLVAWERDAAKDFRVEMPGCESPLGELSGSDYDWDEFGRDWDDPDDEAMAELLDGATLQDPAHLYFTQRTQDHDSRSADEFEPNMQYSSPGLSPKAVAESQIVELPQPEIDWEPVLRQAGTRHGNSSRTASLRSQQAQPTDKQETVLGIDLTMQETPSSAQTPDTFGTMILKPYKTFFHVKEMLEAKQQMFKNQPNAVFELFARVIHSSRENFFHRQYFQFRDLFKEAPPYLSGAFLR